MLTLASNNKEHLQLAELTEAFLASGRKIKTVKGFTEVAPRNPSKAKAKKKPVKQKKPVRPVFWSKYLACDQMLKSAGVTRADLALLVNVHRNTLNQYLTGTYVPMPDVSARIEKTIERLTGIKP